MRSLSRQPKTSHDFPWTVHDFSCFSTTFRVDRLRLLRSALKTQSILRITSSVGATHTSACGSAASPDSCPTNSPLPAPHRSSSWSLATPPQAAAFRPSPRQRLARVALYLQPADQLTAAVNHQRGSRLLRTAKPPDGSDAPTRAHSPAKHTPASARPPPRLRSAPTAAGAGHIARQNAPPKTGYPLVAAATAEALR